MRKVRRPLDHKDPVLNDKIADVAARLSRCHQRGADQPRPPGTAPCSAAGIQRDHDPGDKPRRGTGGELLAAGQRNDARAQARLALSRQLAAQSRVLLSQSADLAALLAVESYRINSDPQARSALLGLLSGNSRLERIRRLPLSGGQLTRDGTEIIVPGYRGVSVWDAASGRRLGPIFGGGARPAARSVARNRLQYEADLSPDDRRLAVYTPARTIELWDLARHRLLATSADPAVVTGGPAVGVYGSGQPRLVYSPDGRYILSTGMDGAYVFDASTLRMIAGPLKIPETCPGLMLLISIPRGDFSSCPDSEETSSSVRPAGVE